MRIELMMDVFTAIHIQGIEKVIDSVLFTQANAEEGLIFDRTLSIWYKYICLGEHICLAETQAVTQPSEYYIFVLHEGQVVMFLPNAVKYAEHQKLQAAHSSSFANFDTAVSHPQKCGCFYCGRIFFTDELQPDCYTTELDGRRTTICPYCGMDSVLHEDSGYPITEEFLQKMNKMFF